METSALIQYYCLLLAAQYRGLPNASGTVQAYVTEVVADQIYSQVLNGFNLFPANGYSAAIGAQLDAIASYVGAPRTIYQFDPSIPYFALTPVADVPATNVGFASVYDATPPVDNWLSVYQTETSYTLTDGQLLLLIQYLIAVHASAHTIYDIDVILQTFFGTYCTFTDNQNMSVTYTHDTDDPNYLFTIVNELNFLPHPAGVEVIVVEV